LPGAVWLHELFVLADALREVCKRLREADDRAFEADIQARRITSVCNICSQPTNSVIWPNVFMRLRARKAYK